MSVRTVLAPYLIVSRVKLSPFLVYFVKEGSRDKGFSWLLAFFTSPHL